MTETNKGEGDRASARAYNKAATRFARNGLRTRARRAAAAIDSAAEERAASRAAETEPSLRETTFEHNQSESLWARVSEALRRDWSQTLNDLSSGRLGDDLGQSVLDTAEQIIGISEIPPSGEPVGVSRQITWESFDRAVEFGRRARMYYPGDWSDVIEERLEADWRALGGDNFDRYREHIHNGWMMADAQGTV